MADFYDLLGVHPTADTAIIRVAYRRLVRSAHPDRGGTEALFRLIQEAWDVLGDPGRRALYDRDRSSNRPSETTHEATYENFRRTYGPRRGTTRSDAEALLQEEFVQKHGRAPGQRPEYYYAHFEEKDPGGDIYDADHMRWVRESNSFYDEREQFQARIDAEDAEYTEAVRLLYATDEEKRQARRERQSREDREHAAEEVLQHYNASARAYRRSVGRLPRYLRDNAPTATRQGISLTSLWVLLAVDLTLWVLLVVGYCIPPALLIHVALPDGASSDANAAGVWGWAVILLMAELLLSIIVPVWPGILLLLSAGAHRLAPRVSEEQDVRRFHEQRGQT